LVVGHGANGLLDKAVPFTSDPWRFSFEGPRLKDSPMATLVDAEEDARSRIVNVYSENSFVATEDTIALINSRIPEFRTGILGRVPPSSFQTFCFVAVACGTDDRFDALCVDVLGNKTYLDLWHELGRERVDVANIPLTLREQLSAAYEQFAPLFE
jgi:hypothetical protein